MFFLEIVNKIFDVTILFILIHVFMSWFKVDRNNKFVKIIDGVVEPMLKVIRDKMPKTGMVDFAPLILIFILEILRNIILRIFL